MAHLLHPNMLERMNDARQYGGEYPVADYLQDLTQVVYADDIRGEPNTYRQNLQVEYLRSLIAITSVTEITRQWRVQPPSPRSTT
jgi:hypothetical protein